MAVADTVNFSAGGGLSPKLPRRGGKPPPLLPPLLGPSGGDRDGLSLGPPSTQLTPPPAAPVGIRGSSLRGVQKDSTPLPTPPGVRPVAQTPFPTPTLHPQLS